MKNEQHKKQRAKSEAKTLIAALVVALAWQNAWADVEIVDGVEWTFTIENGAAVIKPGTWAGTWNGEFIPGAIPGSANGSITVPSVLGGCPVRRIERYAFCACTNLVSVVIPEGVTEIGQFAFEECSKLSSVSLPDSLEQIGSGCFTGCSSALYDTTTLPGFTLVEGWLLGGLFENCPSNPVLSGIRGMETYVFSFCDALESIAIPEGVKRISDRAFNQCSGLRSVSIPDSVTSIGYGAFEECTGLSYFTIPDSVTNIDVCAFEQCTCLASLDIPDSVKSIGWGAFRGSGLRKLRLPVRFFRDVDQFLIPEDCEVEFFGELSLAVSSVHGTSIPFVGSHSFPAADTVSCSASETVIDADNPLVRFVCTGWTGTGSVPASGSGTSFSFPIMEDSTLSWNWETNYWIDCQVGGQGTSSFVPGWFGKGKTVSVPFARTGEVHAIRLSGDTNGVAVNLSSGTISVPVDSPRSLRVALFQTDEQAAVLEGGGAILSFDHSGDALWGLDSDVFASDGSCLRSGVVESGESSVVETSVSGAGLLSFRWRVSGNRGDWCRFFVDGIETNSITRVTDWDTVELELDGGTHTLRWSWEKSASAAANENGAFLDDVCWRPYVWADVQSGFGNAIPVAGSHPFLYGDTVVASVIEPEPADGTRYVCTGWTASGSAPAFGAGHSMSFKIQEDTSIVWNWRKDRWIDVSVSGVGSTTFVPKWVENGTVATIRIEPTTHLYDISLSGDTAGVTLSGTTLSVPSDGPRTISVLVQEVKLSLSVESAHGDPSPASGVHSVSWGTVIDASVIEPVPTNGVQYACTGWAGSGNIPASGVGTNLVFTVEEDSSLVWQWRTNVWLSLACSGPIAASLGAEWVEKGTERLVYYEPLAERYTLALSGDTNGVAWDRDERTLRVPADTPRDLALDLRVRTLSVALDANGFVWTTAGDSPWIPVADESAEGGVLARSGEVYGDNESILATTLSGPGTFSWSWKLEGDDLAGVDVELDGKFVLYLDRPCDWTPALIKVTGDEEHVLRFIFWNAGTDPATHTDRAWIDGAAWTGAPPPAAVTKESPVPVPYSWLAAHAPTILEEAAGSYEAAAVAKAANGRSVWECYIAGIDDPEDPTADFRADIEISNGIPVVTFDPDLGGSRRYEIDGKSDLSDDWGPTNAWSRFFRARVSLPSDWAGVGTTDGFPETVTVTLDPNGGTVDPAMIAYTAPGTLGPLPTPTLDSLPFAGWYSRPVGVVPFSSESIIPWNDLTLFARWGRYAIRFDANGGGGEMSDIQVVFGEDSALPCNSFAKTGYSFAGWAFAPDGDVSLEDGATIKDLTDEAASTKVLYAVWSPNHYTIRFDSNGGEGEMADQEFVYDAPCALATNAFAREGFTFVGWGTQPNTSVRYADRQMVNLFPGEFSDEAVLYAIWTKTDILESISFEINDGTARITGCPTTVGGELNLPPTYQGYPVTSIGDRAFSGCSGLSSITIPDSVTSIGNQAFSGCSGLTLITIPNGVTSIGYETFYDCSGLTSITIPDSVTDIGNEAFYGCSGLTSVIVNSNNPTYDSRGGCNAIIRTLDNVLVFGYKNSSIPAGVTSIGSYAFSGCSEPTSITIPDSVTSIGSRAFYGCSGLTSITIPDSVTSIGDRAFFWCSGLTSITIPDSVTDIGNYAFYGCSKLSTISLPKRFEGNISNLDIPSGCTVIFRE